MHGYGQGHGCGPGRHHGTGMEKMHGTMCCRGFLTKDEKIEMLKEYSEMLKSETKGVEERIKELEKAS